MVTEVVPVVVVDDVAGVIVVTADVLVTSAVVTEVADVVIEVVVAEVVVDGILV